MLVLDKHKGCCCRVQAIKALGSSGQEDYLSRELVKVFKLLYKVGGRDDDKTIQMICMRCYGNNNSICYSNYFILKPPFL